MKGSSGSFPDSNVVRLHLRYERSVLVLSRFSGQVMGTHQGILFKSVDHRQKSYEDYMPAEQMAARTGFRGPLST